jgi:hypothetical protein
MHRRTAERWLERGELVTGNLDLMFWDSVQSLGGQVGTNCVTAEWVSHPKQRHKIISELFGGGLKTYKAYYKVDQPLIFAGSGNYIDELTVANAMENMPVIENSDPLRILIVGELSFNPERITAFEQQGHKLFGLWIEPSGFLCNVGPFYFSKIESLRAVDEIENIKPDIIYGLLNYGSVALAHTVMRAYPEIPFVWHFKESPFFCRQNGLWDKLVDLYRYSDGQIYLNKISKEWFGQITGQNYKPYFILDGDLPKVDWFRDAQNTRISLVDGAFHTVVPGRPYGIHPDHLASLASQDIHLHFYGNFQQNVWARWIEEANQFAPGYLHIHDNCEPEDWTAEFSKYDAGWLHIFDSDNDGELMRATWNDLNYAARIPTLAAAGLPMLFKNNREHICATQELIDKLGVGLTFDSFYEIGDMFRDDALMSEVRANVWKNRMLFSFDYHVAGLVNFFREVIEKKGSTPSRFQEIFSKIESEI